MVSLRFSLKIFVLVIIFVFIRKLSANVIVTQISPARKEKVCPDGNVVLNCTVTNANFLFWRVFPLSALTYSSGSPVNSPQSYDRFSIVLLSAESMSFVSTATLEKATLSDNGKSIQCFDGSVTREREINIEDGDLIYSGDSPSCVASNKTAVTVYWNSSASLPGARCFKSYNITFSSSDSGCLMGPFSTNNTLYSISHLCNNSDYDNSILQLINGANQPGPSEAISLKKPVQVEGLDATFSCTPNGTHVNVLVNWRYPGDDSCFQTIHYYYIVHYGPNTATTTIDDYSFLLDLSEQGNDITIEVAASNNFRDGDFSTLTTMVPEKVCPDPSVITSEVTTEIIPPLIIAIPIASSLVIMIIFTSFNLAVVIIAYKKKTKPKDGPIIEENLKIKSTNL